MATAKRFTIHNPETNQWAGIRFPARTVSERPDAREFSTRKEAEAALKGARLHSGSATALFGFEVVED